MLGATDRRIGRLVFVGGKAVKVRGGKGCRLRVVRIYILYSKNNYIILLMGGNPAPVDMANIPLFLRFHTSQVLQDFFHQQYDHILKQMEKELDDSDV